MINRASVSVQKGPSNTVSVGNSMRIGTGQETTILRGGGTYFFSNPTTTGGDIVKITNRSGHPIDIGFGKNSYTPFIGSSSDPNVPDGEIVTADASPIIRAYLGAQVRESEIVSEEIYKQTPVWESDFRVLQQSTTVNIHRRSDGLFAASVAGGFPHQRHAVNEFSTHAHVKSSPPPPAIPSQPAFVPQVSATQVSFNGVEDEIAYSATLAFADGGIVAQGTKNIAESLASTGYKIKYTTITGFTEAIIEMTLPPGFSCAQAETDINTVMNSQMITAGRACIRSRRGARMISSGVNITYWASINPASPDWYQSQRNMSTLIASKRYSDGVPKTDGRIQVAPFSWNYSYGR
ncbi:hypothetical protein NLI96_g6254 [Meripilus lineatus]|uniref:Uncharacterized protein n=1 Tax=Meripilus lineatus TaxID=2056292 RepID=A0AAD5V180_9APHY|nr:hypothetical protein NLI96_g6254 [Physisporinus lineatus]